jgi:cytochrome c2
MNQVDVTPPRPAGEMKRSLPRIAFWVVWPALSAAAIAIIISAVRVGLPVWELPRDLKIYLGSLALAHLLASAALMWRMFWHSRVRLRDVVLAVTGAFAVCGFLLFLGSFSEYSRSVFVASLLASYVLAYVPYVLNQPLRYVALVLLGFVSGAFLFPDRSVAEERARTERKFETSALYNVALTIFHNVVPSGVTGGAVEPFGTGFLVAAGDAGLYYVEPSASDEIHTVKLPHRVPMNRDEFLADKAKDVPDGFRVADMIVEESDERVRLFASHHYWNRSAKCYVIRVSEADTDRESLLRGKNPLTWKTVFETKPCMPLNVTKLLFVGVQIGGGLARLDENTILVAVGDGEYDGWNSKLNMPQDTTSDFGKTIRIDLNGGERTIYSIGHRNPQGLHVTPDGTVWASEHGPRGGDELNIIKAGVNYGWPSVTYGTEYGTLSWPPSEDPGRHTGYESPVFAWAPSIGVSSIISVQQPLFGLWRGDLLIGSLRDRTLYRARIEGQRVVYVEPLMRIGYPVRDLVELPDGRVALLFDGGDVGVLSPIPDSDSDTTAAATPSSTENKVDTDSLVLGQCRGCHSIGDGTAHGIGPDLKGIVGRRIASAPGYEYSEALKGLSGRWTRERLDQFLWDPMNYAPGTSMKTDVIPNGNVRKKLIDYLASQQ